MPHTQTLVAEKTVGTVEGDKTIQCWEEGIPPRESVGPTKGPEYASVFYKKSNSTYGSQPPEVRNRPKHALDSRYTDWLAKAGMYRNYGLNTHVQPDRFMDGTRDWMLKIV
uniref:Uncharacterized protein n=1 Tax=Chromera velia CCMP2878 TaxID=1169474 RepID=A0A0G4HWJ3_9ALVE|mmetsp:Transcript_9890/g.19178  ORF Transcript_9890/g.19178 Transcript_9890/m.19178 type:complete len:111 (-) Transcript_9890:453-785(-)|eukprot:Cvel_9028.t1-p1 / transcript=Cvel_9028.t1 / gene=Cvel_9028 / organism=Chromera_velia_CCMP2878 / gene_product=hypothetical protein / transcript_product=hypothetical protein / location=Cvel_scaffold512:92-1814(-) / protein_length=110 / sequence_SO=supercontig / SO=protein_coding / is_pseudo=false